MPSAQPTIASDAATAGSRSKAPVFVLGSVRSGTTLLYHMLLSSGNFVVYRTESNVFNLLEPRFGDLSAKRNRRRLLRAWYDSRLFALTGLDKQQLELRISAECRNGGDFLRIVMEEMARKQGVERWADTTPDHLLYLDRIKQTIPSALIIHIIRDGRDAALSADKQHYVRALPWDRTPSLLMAAMYWEWMVRKGRKGGRKLGNDYLEVHFEELIERPRETLARVGAFIEHELDYDRIQTVGIGSVSKPNTSFGENADFNPLGRWKGGYSPRELAEVEALTGDTLQELGYELATKDATLLRRPDLQRTKALYKVYFDSKLYLKTKTPLGRLFVTRDLSWV
jgi:sulfotransferase family protein